MGEARAWAPHEKWSADEASILTQNYSDASWEHLEAMLPGRSRRKIQCKASGMGLERTKTPKRTAEEARKAKAAHMARKREADPEATRQYQNRHRAKNKDRLNAKTREQTARRIFWARALRLRNGITARDLAQLWKRQRGRCALTGRKLDRSAEIDHKQPRAIGGIDALDNLQWVTHAANRAKRHLTDQQFIALCSDVVGWHALNENKALGGAALEMT